VDGELLDNDFPLGVPPMGGEECWKLDAEYLTSGNISPAISPETAAGKKADLAPVQYWMPAGHNNWVGDVATCYHQGRYHVFYLL